MLYFSSHFFLRLCRFSLTLIDTLDTLVVSPSPSFLCFCFVFCFFVDSCLSVHYQVLNKLDEFEDAVRKTVSDVRLDNDVVVSVFETNIRVLGYETYPVYYYCINTGMVLKLY